MKYYIVFVLISINTEKVLSLDSTSMFKNINFLVYNELYYNQNINDLNQNQKPNFLYNHKFENTFGINTLIGKISIKDTNYRGNFGLIFGSFSSYNMMEEPSWASFLYEANVGFKISKKQNIWIDLGLMNSHLGFESAIGADCWTVTRSILAENSPYYETGAKISFTSKNEKWYIAAMYLNGWQNIAKITGKSNHSLGGQITWKPSSNFTLNYSNFLGNAQPDSNRNMRFYNNFYAIYEEKKWGFIAGFDLGVDKNVLKEQGIWYAPVAIVRYQLNPKNTFALRGEYYRDAQNIIIEIGKSKPVNLWAISSNFDFKFMKYFLWRNEIKYFFGNQELFNGQQNNISFTSSFNIIFK